MWPLGEYACCRTGEYRHCIRITLRGEFHLRIPFHIHIDRTRCPLITPQARIERELVNRIRTPSTQATKVVVQSGVEREVCLKDVSDVVNVDLSPGSDRFDESIVLLAKVEVLLDEPLVILRREVCLRCCGIQNCHDIFHGYGDGQQGASRIYGGSYD